MRTLTLTLLKTQIALGFQPCCDKLSLFNEKCFKFNIFTLEITLINVTNLLSRVISQDTELA